MAEGVAVAGRTTGGGVHDDPDAPPPPGPDAPKGWTWDRPSRSWKAKQRGAVLWTGEHGIPKGSVFVSARDAADEARLQQLADDINRDPDPHYLRNEPRPGDDSGAPVAFENVPQEVKDDIAGLGGLVATPVLALMKAVDPYCGGALADNFGGVMDATLPLICRSKKIIDYFTGDSTDWLLWGKLALALAPVGKAIAEHHILKTVETVRDEKTGEIFVRPTVKGGSQHGDHLQPPAHPEPAYEYAA